MSYTQMRGYGSYYMEPMSGYGFGATASDFNGEGTWSDCLAGSAGNNAAGKRCGQAIQAGLNQLGYGPLTVDGQIGPATIAAIKRFGSDNGFGSNLTWPTKAMVLKMEELLKAGEKPGPGPAVESHIVGGEYVPGGTTAGGASKASMGMMIGIGALALIAIGGLALVAKKKGEQPKSPSASMRV